MSQRDKIAMGLMIVLVPLMFFLFYTNIKKAKQLRRTPSGSGSVQTPLDVAKVLQTVNQPRPAAEPAVSPKMAEERQRISTGLPVRSPFSTLQQAKAPVPVVAPVVPVTPVVVPRPKDPVEQPVALPKPVTKEQPPAPVIKVAGAVSAGGGKRMAMIGGRLYGEGETVSGFKILEVGSNYVIFGSGDKRFSVSFGREQREPVVDQ
ncbi:MAG: hypothetical protein C0404_08525 [Verrucomicrobia bacterium]|nr:hypothetical protein [Verrucomicrobiota bacterium]